MVTSNDNRPSNQTDLRGLSSDTKPTLGIAENTLFLEVDTGDFYYFHDGSWAKVGA